MRDLFALLCVQFAKRNTPKRKERFLAWLAHSAQDLGFEVHIDEKKKGKMSSRNLLVGNFSKCENIVVTGYDTPSKVMMPGYTYYPFNFKKDHKQEMIALAIQMASSIFVIFLFYLLVRGFNDYNIWMKVGAVIIGIAMIVISFFLGKGMANKYNFNKNTSALCVGITLMQEAAAAKDNRTAFVFCDNVSASFYGYAQIAENMEKKLKGKNLIILDCVASDGDVFIAHKKADKQLAEGLAKHLPGSKLLERPTDVPGCMQWFNNLMYVTSGIADEQHEIKIKNTRSRKDGKLDMDRLEAIHKMLTSYLNIETNEK